MGAAVLDRLYTRPAVTSLPLLGQDAMDVHERIGDSQDFFLGKTNSCSLDPTISLQTSYRCLGSRLQMPQGTSSIFALFLYFPLNMHNTCCTLVTQVTICVFSNQIFLLPWYDYLRFTDTVTQVALRVLAADSVVASLRVTTLIERVGIPVGSLSGSMNSDWNPVACLMILA